MSALEDVNKLWPQLTPADKAQVLKWAARDVGEVFPGIESTPGVCGGEPCVIRTRIPVWLLEQGRRQGLSEAQLLAAYPTLRAQDLVAVWAYVRSHQSQIDDLIAENEAA